MNAQPQITEFNDADENVNVDVICNSLHGLGLNYSAKRITDLFYVKEEDSEPGIHLTLNSVLEYFEFAKNKYFDNEPGISLDNNGDLNAFWELSDDKYVKIKFQQNKNLTYLIKTTDNIISNSTSNNEIIKVLVENKVCRS